MRALIDGARGLDAHLIPYGDGTSVVGGVTTTTSDADVVTIDLGGVSGLDQLSRRDQLATFGAGTTGPRVEALLRAEGLTLGHFPQSFELSTLGGWVATRSSGQQSLGYAGHVRSLDRVQPRRSGIADRHVTVSRHVTSDSHGRPPFAAHFILTDASGTEVPREIGP